LELTTASNGRADVIHRFAEPMLMTLATVYTLGAVIALTYLLFSWRAIRVLQRKANLVDEPQWRQPLNAWHARMGVQRFAMRRPIRLLHSNQVDVPVTMGIWNPTIVIPSCMVANPAGIAVDAILVHELAHIARADFAWQLLQRLVRVALWFHPLTWIAERRTAFIRERACDEFVLHTIGDPDAYIETLLDLASMLSRRRGLALGVATLRSGKLARRLEALKRSSGKKQFIAPSAARMSLVAGAMFASVVLASVVIGRAAAHDVGLESSSVSPSLIAAMKKGGADLTAVIKRRLINANLPPDVLAQGFAIAEEHGPKIYESYFKRGAILTDQQQAAQKAAAKAVRDAGKKGREAVAEIEAALMLTPDQKLRWDAAQREATTRNIALNVALRGILNPEQQAKYGLPLERDANQEPTTK
jgi:beta-lactamase regulating signal transducer with metallopeptidase domain